MIPENEWLLCQAPGCGKPIKPHRKEGRGQYAIRRFCNRQCVGARTLKHVELRKCGNPACSNLVPRDPGMKPTDYARRKSCSPECTHAVQSISARMRTGSYLKKPRRHGDIPKELVGSYQIGIGFKSKKRKPLEAPRLINEADAIAAFIAQNGITYCPPKYGAVTLNAALPDSKAQEIIKRMLIEDRSYKAVNNAFWAAKKQSQVIGNT